MQEVAPLIKSFIQNEFPDEFNRLANVNRGAAFQQLRLTLIAAIRELIKTNTEKLGGILYRIDVSEAKLQQALASRGPVLPEEIIADLIIERQIQKLRTRKSFQQNEETDWDFDL